MWFVAATRALEEDRAFVHLTNQGFVPFLPKIRKTVRHARRTTVKSLPLFPGYLFIDGSRAERWRSVNGTQGVRHLITHDERPAVVEAGFVEALLAMSAPDGVVDLRSRINVGDTVEFASGPLARRIGLLVELDGRGRASVLMELLSGQVRVRTRARQASPRLSGRGPALPVPEAHFRSRWPESPGVR